MHILVSSWGRGNQLSPHHCVHILDRCVSLAPAWLCSPCSKEGLGRRTLCQLLWKDFLNSVEVEQVKGGGGVGIQRVLCFPCALTPLAPVLASSRPGCSMPEIWDVEDPANAGKPPLCTLLVKDSEPHFTTVFQNSVYKVLEVIEEWPRPLRTVIVLTFC